MRGNIPPLEQETQEIIQSLGDISVKAIKENENAIAKKGIDKLTEIGLKFLELKSENEEKLSVSSSEDFFEPKSNQYISYISEEIERTFQISLMEKNYNISKHIISQLHRLLTSTLNYPNNHTILEKLVETSHYFGSLYFSLYKLTYENNAPSIRNILGHHLINMPRYAISNNNYQPEYIYSFLHDHVYRILKLIIDENDLVHFKWIIDYYITSMVFSEPDSIANDIYNDLYIFYSVNLSDPKFENFRDELQFMIQNTCMMNLNEIHTFEEKLDSFKKLILSNSKDDEKENQIKPQFKKIFKKLIKFRICFELSAALYRMSAYALFKNKPEFIQEFWYHIKPKSIHIMNSSLLPSSPNWVLLYSIYIGSGSAVFYDIDDYGFFQESKSFRELYATLLLFKMNKLVSLPNEKQIEQWSIKKKFYILEYWYDLIYHYPVKKLLDSLVELRKYPKFLEMLQQNENIENMDKKFKEFKKSIQGIKENQQKIINLIDRHTPISNEKFLEFKNNEIKNYQEYSITQNFKNIVYDKNICESDSKPIKRLLGLKRSALIPRRFIESSFSMLSHSPIAYAETEIILKHLQTKIKKDVEETDDFIFQLNTSIQKLINNDFTPDVIFLPLVIVSKLRSKHYQYFDQLNRYVFNENFTLKIIHSWKGLDFEDIIIFDSNQLQLKYEAESSERIRFTYSEINDDIPMIDVSAEMFFNIKIIDKNAFLRIRNPKIKQLRK